MSEQQEGIPLDSEEQGKQEERKQEQKRKREEEQKIKEKAKKLKLLNPSTLESVQSFLFANGFFVRCCHPLIFLHVLFCALVIVSWPSQKKLRSLDHVENVEGVKAKPGNDIKRRP